MEGYKVFEPDWTCRGFQYEVGKTYEEDVTPVCCYRGFHFCTKASDGGMVFQTRRRQSSKQYQTLIQTNLKSVLVSRLVISMRKESQT